ncbi:putative aflatoxin biosynthesis ketoreductase nor-1 protein [Botrytis fragariae]|uniref:Putative aflatoxin biosynthesis ketoreductase nor-1 protein n=1 Tax=Botrytis fragariae TaxID=1964551 RepID=A0A8H6ELU3_9HELO|nr:putative aflatoxin biosynthesis ketoreductase nor-1 protein [Botrytis fragariae]KAF5876899.1 putative aflatoxin biosynthesis ketoreductase nor-1 protein [Botrytis fragariae]
MATGSRIIPLKISSTDDLSPSQAVETLQNTHGITSIDVVIANAGISQYYGKVSETPLSEVRNHFEVNTIGVLTLYQATLPLLLKSPNPIFVALSTAVASIGAMENIPIPATPYGMSKVALNYMVRKIHFENEKLTAFVLTPGWVETEMGNAGAIAMGLESAPVKIEESIKGMLEKIDNATREGTSGTLQSFDETKYPW